MTDDEDRFWSKVRIGDGCWEWQGALLRNGYGAIAIRRLRWRAHRLAWALSHGPIPPGMCVCHRCDNPACVRPGHLWLGTHDDNMRDRSAKGRQARGEHLAHAKLNDEAVREMRRRAAAGQSVCSLSREFGVSVCTAQKVVKREKWKHVE